MKKPNSNRMIARRSSKSGVDDYPTPPWATRALYGVVLPRIDVKLEGKTVLEPACGRGHMVRALKETGARVTGRDVRSYEPGFGLRDFLIPARPEEVFRWVITNPPYKHAEAFFRQASLCSLEGVALLMRLNWLQGENRYSTLFRAFPPRVVAVFAGRIPARKGRIVKSAPVYFQHCWIVWKWTMKRKPPTELMWIPPNAQEDLEREEDYS